MGEILQFRSQQEVTNTYNIPQTDGSLALAGAGGPPEDPRLGRRKRHLAVVLPLSDEPLEEVAAASPVIELAQRRIQPEPLIPWPSPARTSRREAKASVPAKPVERQVFSAPKPEVKMDATEFFYSKEWVQREVARIKKIPVKIGENPLWHLRDTGFWIPEQIGQFVRSLQGVGQSEFPDVLELELAKVREDFKHFEREYLQQMASLSFNLGWQVRDGQKRIICTDYKGKGADKDGTLWESVTSPDEREGIVFETLFGPNGVEEKLRHAKPGDMIGVFSPAGWSGYKDKIYPEVQNYFIQVQKDGSLRAHTFRIDATIMQVEALQRRFGLTIPEAKSQKDRIKNTIANVAYLKSGEHGIRNFEDVVDAIQGSVGGREVAYGKGGGVKTFSEIKEYLKDPKRFMTHHTMTDKLHERFADYARWRLAQGGSWDAIETDLGIALSLNPTQLNRAYDLEAKGGGFGGTMFTGGAPLDSEAMLVQQAQLPGGFNFAELTKDLEKKPGCAGGGGESGKGDKRYESGYATSMGGSRVAIKTGASEDYDFSETGTCVVCGDGPKAVGPCSICISCDGKLGGKGASMSDESAESKNEYELVG